MFKELYRLFKTYNNDNNSEYLDSNNNSDKPTKNDKIFKINVEEKEKDISIISNKLNTKKNPIDNFNPDLNIQLI